jgi:hypothetical protein
MGKEILRIRMVGRKKTIEESRDNDTINKMLTNKRWTSRITPLPHINSKFKFNIMLLNFCVCIKENTLPL